MLMLTDYQTYGVFFLRELRGTGEWISRSDLAQAAGISIESVQQVMMRLIRAGLVTHKMGPAGGYQLTSRRHMASVLDVVDALLGQGKPGKMSERVTEIRAKLTEGTRRSLARMKVDDL
jgi:DNA-binding IscR family transcriptional regulator